MSISILLRSPQWHTVTLTADGYDQSLYIDNSVRIGMAGSPALANTDPNNYIGAGLFSANTTAKTWLNAPGATNQAAITSYFTGNISNVSYYTSFLTAPQLAPDNQPKPVTGPISSALPKSLCIDDGADGSVVQIWTCNNTAAQQWTITPDNAADLNATVGIDNLCLDVHSGGTTNGTPVDLYHCNDSPSEQWHMESDGQLWNPQSGKCLADPASNLTNGTQLLIWDCDYANEQDWHTP